jgi:hypothetical protein
MSSAQSILRLPSEILYEIGTYIQREMQFRTLANLNQTCRLLRDVTLPVLYETVFYTGWTFGKAWQRTKEQNKGWKHVK